MITLTPTQNLVFQLLAKINKACAVKTVLLAGNGRLDSKTQVKNVLDALSRTALVTKQSNGYYKLSSSKHWPQIEVSKTAPTKNNPSVLHVDPDLKFKAKTASTSKQAASTQPQKQSTVDVKQAKPIIEPTRTQPRAHKVKAALDALHNDLKRPTYTIEQFDLKKQTLDQLTMLLDPTIADVLKEVSRDLEALHTSSAA